MRATHVHAITACAEWCASTHTVGAEPLCGRNFPKAKRALDCHSVTVVPHLRDLVAQLVALCLVAAQQHTGVGLRHAQRRDASVEHQVGVSGPFFDGDSKTRTEATARTQREAIATAFIVNESRVLLRGRVHWVKLPLSRGTPPRSARRHNQHESGCCADITMSKLAAKLTPLLDRVLVEKVAAKTKTVGGILLPESASSKVRVTPSGQRVCRESPWWRLPRSRLPGLTLSPVALSPVPDDVSVVLQVNEGKVVACGPGRRDKDGQLLPLGACGSCQQRVPGSREFCFQSLLGELLTADWPRTAAAGVKPGDRVLLPDYGGQSVKLQDTECVASHRAQRWS